jgi:sugar-specific transcriptional regulator TrmB
MKKYKNHFVEKREKHIACAVPKMSVTEGDVQLLTDIGFTKTQAKLYLTLLKLGLSTGSTIYKKLDVPRTVIYRTLDEMQKMGLVEKELTTPYKYKATPLKHGMQILISQRRAQYEKIVSKAKEFLYKMQDYNEEKTVNKEYTFSIIDGKERILQIMKENHKGAKKSVYVLTTLDRWMQILTYCFKEFKESIARIAKYHLVVQIPNYEFTFPERVHALLANPSFELKTTYKRLQNNIGVFDSKYATFNFFPAKPLGDSPVLYTNHPSFLSMAQDHFEKVWKSAEKYKL